MDRGKEVYRSVQVTDNVKTASLSILDQIRLILSHVSNDDSAELDVNERVSVDRLNKIAGLTDFFQRAIDTMKKHGKNSCTMQVSSEFLPYLDEVIGENTDLGKFYNFEVTRKNVPLTVKHFFLVKVTGRG